jgi:ABC-type uncharacterized transport system ATPase component
MAQKTTVLTSLEQTMLQKLKEAAQALQVSSSRREALKKEVEELKAQLQASQPQQYTKCSTSTLTALSAARANLKSVEAAAKQEHNATIDKELAAISQRNAKSLANSEFKKALAGSYETATRAINQRRKLINDEGITVELDISGNTCKALLDGDQLETFEQIFSDELEIQGTKYAVIGAQLSDIGSSNTYKIKRIK